MNSPHHAAALVALDWGTTALRAYLLGADGAVLDYASVDGGDHELLPAGGFDQAFDETCGAWLERDPALPVIAAGMVGSAQGWMEAPYIETPADASALVNGIVR